MPPRRQKRRATLPKDSVAPVDPPEPSAPSHVQTILHVAEPSYIIAKRRRPSHPNPSSASGLLDLRSSLDEAVDCAHAALLSKPLTAISVVASTPAPPGRVPAICLALGDAAAAGDDAAFALAVHTLGTHAPVLELNPARHTTLPALSTALVAEAHHPRLAVAVRDAHRFSPALLSDLVYLLCRRDGLVTALFALPSAHVLLAALSLRDAARLDLTTVHPPSPPVVLDHTVTALFDSPAPLPTRSVAVALTRAFFDLHSTMPALRRALRHMLALHVAAVPVAPALLALAANFGNESPPSDKLVKEIVTSLPSARSANAEKPAARRELVLNWVRNAALWRLRLRTLRELLHSLANILGVDIRQALAAAPQQAGLMTALLVMSVPRDRKTPHGLDVVAKRVIDALPHASRARLSETVAKLRVTLGTTTFKEVAALEKHMNALIDMETKLVDGFAGSTQAPVPSTTEITPSRGLSSKTARKKTRHAQGAQAASVRRREALIAGTEKAGSQSVLTGVRKMVATVVRAALAVLCAPRELPLHEAFFFDDAEALGMAGGGSGEEGAQPRLAVFEALRDPQRIIGPMRTDHYPDASLAFEILAEGGRLVSLYDWYNTFASMRSASAMSAMATQANTEPKMIEENGDQGGAENDQMEVDDEIVPDQPDDVDRGDDEALETPADAGISQAELQARFARACSELELIGLFKYTNRKTDHVMRLAYE